MADIAMKMADLAATTDPSAARLKRQPKHPLLKCFRPPSPMSQSNKRQRGRRAELAAEPAVASVEGDIGSVDRAGSESAALSQARGARSRGGLAPWWTF